MRVGVLGGGQLGRMLALAGYPLGLRFRFLESKAPCPVDGLGEVVRAGYDDPAALEPFSERLDVVTYEFENVPVGAAAALAEKVPVHPAPAALRLAQDRLIEKEGFRELDIPTAPYHAVETREDLEEGLARIGLPAVLKTRRFGYDGKGQEVVRDAVGADAAWDALGGRPLLLEGFVDFSRELSLVAVRSRGGEIRHYPLVENDHRDGILFRTIAPAPLVGDALRDAAEGYVRRLLESLDYVGVLALELFQDGETLLANEMAPRVHNSGHWTQDGAVCSQFENHLRAVCGLPLGVTAPVVGHAAMVNVLGRPPASEAVLSIEGAHLHLYDKSSRPGRKLGHVNVVGTDFAEVRARLDRVEALLDRSGGPG